MKSSVWATRLRRLWSPPVSRDFEQTQKARLVHVALAVSGVGAIPLALVNLQQRATTFAGLLFVLAALSLVGLVLNSMGRTRLAVVFLAALIYGASVFTIIDGAGLADPGVLAFPILILLATFFFAWRGSLVSTVLSIATMIVLRQMALAGRLEPLSSYGAGRFEVTSILLITLAALAWVVSASWEGSLAELRQTQSRLELALRGARLAVFDLDLPSGALGIESPFTGPGGIFPSPSNLDDWKDNLHPDDRDRVVASLEDYFRGASSYWTEEYRARGLEGTWEWRLVLGRTTVRDASGQPQRMAGVVADITKGRQAQDDLVASERRYRLLSRELHDSVTQTLYSLRLTLEAARLALDRDRGHAAALLSQVDSLATSALDEMRALLRQARPEALEQQGLVAALGDHLSGLRAREELEVDYEVNGDRELTVDQELCLYRGAQEALSNVSKHSEVRQAYLRLDLSGDPVVLEVEDHGRGFSTDPFVTPPGSLGMTTMRERVESLGGSLTVDSQPGRGTRVRFEIPATAERAHG